MPRRGASKAERRARRPQPRSEAKRARILETAIRYFAERGYEGARAEDMAAEMGIAKGSIFQHFKTKEALFLAAFKQAVERLKKYLDAPPEVRENGFFEVVRYWLERSGHLEQEARIPYRVVVVGNYGTELRLRREINRYLMTQDPYGVLAFVRWGIERGEVRDDVEPKMTASLLESMVERFQDALLIEGLDPGLFRRQEGRPQPQQERIEQFVEIIRSAIGRG